MKLCVHVKFETFISYSSSKYAIFGKIYCTYEYENTHNFVQDNLCQLKFIYSCSSVKVLSNIFILHVQISSYIGQRSSIHLTFDLTYMYKTGFLKKILYIP